jgi:hypothetical protein
LLEGAIVNRFIMPYSHWQEGITSKPTLEPGGWSLLYGGGLYRVNARAVGR